MFEGLSHAMVIWIFVSLAVMVILFLISGMARISSSLTCEIGMTRSNPNFLHSGQLFEPANFVFVSPDHQVFSRGRAARVDPVTTLRAT